MWQIYEELIEAVPPDLRVERCLVGLNWTLVQSKNTGIAMTTVEGPRRSSLAGSIVGMPVRELAKQIKSWNEVDAALGLAAINSVLNEVNHVREWNGALPTHYEEANAFTVLRDQVVGKRVSVIGHFPSLESWKDICQLSILERHPQDDDLPDPACEYLLPEQDFVFMTATTLINKTFPRLLQLARKSRVILVGPSTPMTPILFQYGVDVLGGMIVTEAASVWQAVGEGGDMELFRKGGLMVQMTAH
ncbi:hypothetical protein D2Q93_11110 [Alicyclobacillaceae bacterium I2511]|nr:hypothetical protein D2Q93_11110 [Alicyclobacillaceae bacterium I2511]